MSHADSLASRIDEEASSEHEEFVATLIFPDEYRRQINQVAGLTTKRIEILKHKFASRSGSELVSIPMDQCVFISYRDRRPVYVLVAGVLLSLVALGSLGFLAISWSSIPPGTRIPTGGLFVGTVVGLRMAFGARRHELTFALRGRSDVKWTSRPGDFKYKQSAVDKVLEFARRSGLLMRRSR